MFCHCVARPAHFFFAFVFCCSNGRDAGCVTSNLGKHDVVGIQFIVIVVSQITFFCRALLSSEGARVPGESAALWERVKRLLLVL